MLAVSGSKVEKYITSILEDLGFNNEGITAIYFHNMIFIGMGNSKNPN